MENKSISADERFVYLVEDKFNYHLDSDDITVVVGTVHGTVRRNDAVYVIDHTGKTILAEVKQLESINDKGTEHPDSCTDSPIALILGISTNDIDKYCVITSIRPWINKDVNTAVENPYLLGMLYGEEFNEDQLYFSKLVYALAHSYFLAPASMDKNGDGDDQTQVSFPTLANERFPGKTTLAVFTDWIELNKWEGAPRDGEGKIQTVILRFPDIVHLVADPGINGCVVNAFGAKNLFVPTSLVDEITSLEGYKKENGESPKTDN